MKRSTTLRELGTLFIFFFLKREMFYCKGVTLRCCGSVEFQGFSGILANPYSIQIKIC